MTCEAAARRVRGSRRTLWANSLWTFAEWHHTVTCAPSGHLMKSRRLFSKHEAAIHSVTTAAVFCPCQISRSSGHASREQAEEVAGSHPQRVPDAALVVAA